MDIVGLVVWLLLLVGTIVAWCVVACFAWMVGWSLSEGRVPGQPKRPYQLRYALWVGLLVAFSGLTVAAFVFGFLVISPFI